MAEEETPAQTSGALGFMKQTLRGQLVGLVNSTAGAVLNQFALSEIYSWPFQQTEARAIQEAGDDATLEMAPFLVDVCRYQFGEATEAERLTQVKEKAGVVANLATNFLTMAAALNGLRAAGEDAIEAAQSEADAFLALTEATMAIEDWRRGAGF